MTEQYTPTTEQVRDDYQRCGCDRCSLTDDSDWADEHAEFDRWLAEHDRQVSEHVWDNCITDVLVAPQVEEDGRWVTQLPANQHRQERA